MNLPDQLTDALNAWADDNGTPTVGDTVNIVMPIVSRTQDQQTYLCQQQTAAAIGGRINELKISDPQSDADAAWNYTLDQAADIASTYLSWHTDA